MLFIHILFCYFCGQINETIILYKRMANVIKLRKGLDINLKGKAAEEFMSVKEPGFYSLVPDDFTGITPKVVVKEQEYVMAGGPLFIDKNHPELKFVSPVSGVVTSVERGARRKVLNIVVEAAAEQDYEEFGKMDPSKMSAQEVKDALLQAGMFAFIRQRPYDVIADPTVTPKAIFISAFDSNPLAPDFEFVLKGEEANFQTGLDALSRMAKTYLSISVKQKAAALVQAKNVTLTAFDGPNPAGNVGVQINYFYRLELDYRQYKSVGHRKVFAWTAQSKNVFGNVPLTQYSLTGTPFDLRGYYMGQYRDKSSHVVMAEYRQMINTDRSNWIKRLLHHIGFVAWTGCGFMGPTMGKIEGVLPNYGVGLRIEVQPRMNVRLDLGKNTVNDQTLFYFNMTEAF